MRDCFSVQCLVPRPITDGEGTVSCVAAVPAEPTELVVAAGYLALVYPVNVLNLSVAERILVYPHKSIHITIQIYFLCVVTFEFYAACCVTFVSFPILFLVPFHHFLDHRAEMSLFGKSPAGAVCLFLKSFRHAVFHSLFLSVFFGDSCGNMFQTSFLSDFGFKPASPASQPGSPPASQPASPASQAARQPRRVRKGT